MLGPEEERPANSEEEDGAVERDAVAAASAAAVVGAMEAGGSKLIPALCLIKGMQRGVLTTARERQDKTLQGQYSLQDTGKATQSKRLMRLCLGV